MIRLKTDTTGYWTDQLAVTDDDLAHLLDWIHDRGVPCSLSDLAQAVVERRLAEERAAIARELAKGVPYEPKGSYQVGQRLVFPAFDFMVGEVVGERPGANPTYGAFKVIQVRFDDDGDVREFASQLTQPHKLNLDTALGSNEASVGSIIEQYGESLTTKLAACLADAEGLGFVQLDGQWFLRDLMAPIHEGHLNLAEALIDVNRGAMRTEDLLSELDLPRETPRAIALFSLELALRGDQRFDEVEAHQKPAWYLARLEPDEVRAIPGRLAWTPLTFSRSGTLPLLAEIEKQLDDELTDLREAPTKIKPGDEYSVVLSYPHRRAGALPLTPRTRGFFPATTEAGRAMFQLVDAQSGKGMRAWVVGSAKYVVGLTEWYRQHDLAAGALVHLQKTDDPLKVLVSVVPRRMHRDWVRVADEQNGELVFRLQKKPVAYEYDPLMLVAEDSLARMDLVWSASQQSRRSLEDDLLQVFLELAKLSPQGTAHAKTVYAAFNIKRRSPPGLLFSALCAHPSLEHVGEGHFAYKRSGA